MEVPLDLSKDRCPKCGHVWARRNPLLTVDIIIEMEGRPGSIVLVSRKNEPKGWALPGGFVDYGETVETAAAREAKEETGLDVELPRQFRAYSDPSRDPRGHTVSVVFTARASGTPKGGDDARIARVFDLKSLPEDIAFDHRIIIEDYLEAGS
jgi:8-oxo-dGTP diphosphatase